VFLNKRQANKRKRELQQTKAKQRKLKKQILWYIKMNRMREVGFLMERYKARYGKI